MMEMLDREYVAKVSGLDMKGSGGLRGRKY